MPIPVRIKCRPCGREFAGDGLFLKCPRCSGLDTKLIEGDELFVFELDVDQ